MTQHWRDLARKLRWGLAVAIVASIAAGGLAAYFGFALSEVKPERDKTLEEDVKLLAKVMNKLAGASEDKGLALLASLFSGLAQLAATDPVTTIDRQWIGLCQDPGAQSLFETVALGIQQSYDAVCERYRNLIGLPQALSMGTIGTDQFQASFNLLIIALIDLDNAIASDP